MYSKASVTELQREIASFRDTFITTAPSRDTNENWNFFTHGLMKIIHKLVPQKVTRQRHDLPWLDRQLRTKINRKNRYHNTAKKAKPAFKKQRREAYKHQQSIVQKEIKTAYNNYINSLFEDQESHKPSKRFWKTIKAKRRDQVGIPPLRKRKDGTLETTAKGKTGILNAQYASVFKGEDPSKIPSLRRSPYPSMNRIQVTFGGVKKLLLKLNPKEAVGPALVPTQILRDYADEITPILQVIFQQSLDTGKVPDQWKTANVSGIFKKGDKYAAANYRPVSLTCVSCKLLEHILFRAIMDRVDHHKILKFFQHGFRAKHSCETQLINTIEDLANGLELDN